MKLEILYKENEVKTFLKIHSLTQTKTTISYEHRHLGTAKDVKDLLEVRLDGELIYIDPEYEKEQAEKMRKGIKALVNIDKSLKSLFEELREEDPDDE